MHLLSPGLPEVQPLHLEDHGVTEAWAEETGPGIEGALVATRKQGVRSTPASISSDVEDTYPALLAEVKERIRTAQYAALRAVTKELVGLCWDIGQLIVARQQVAGRGKGLVQQLAADLRIAFPGVSGFSAQSLWHMRQYFHEYSVSPKLQPLVGEVGWTHNLLIMSRCKDPLEREFYPRMTRKFGWSKNVLSHPINNQSYEKSLLGQTNFDQRLTIEGN